MAKGLRSKVKRAYRSMKREKMEPVYKKKLRATVSSLHAKAGMEQADTMDEEREEKVVKHGGFRIGTSFVPDHERPKLNVVHGPNANKGDDDEGKTLSLMTEAKLEEEQEQEESAMNVDNATEENENDGSTKMELRSTKTIQKTKHRKNSVLRKPKKSSRHSKNKTRRSVF